MKKTIPKQLYFVTGNPNKAKEFQSIINNQLQVENRNIDLAELQGEPLQISQQKAMLAFKELKLPVLVEDTSLCFNALKELPGPYIKWFLDKLGHEGLNKMLAGFDDKTAFAQCIFSYMGPELEKPVSFVGRTNGSIVAARGKKYFGWDPIFQPEGFTQTYAEMDIEQKNKISHRFKAIQKLKEYFLE